MVFLNIGRQPVLPLRRLEDMLAHDRTGLKNLLTTLRKEQVTASAKDEEEESPEEDEQPEEPEEIWRRRSLWRKRRSVRSRRYHAQVSTSPPRRLPGVGERSRGPCRDGRQAEEPGRPTVSIKPASMLRLRKLIKRVTVLGEFYLVRAGNTRKGSGTFYTQTGTGGADCPSHPGAALLRQGRGWHARSRRNRRSSSA